MSSGAPDAATRHPVACMAVGLAVFAADQVTKLLVVRALPLGATRSPTPWFSLVHWRNPGGLWGILQEIPGPWQTAIFLILPLVGIGLLLALFGKSAGRADLFLLSAILGAAFGNLADRVRLGAVVDFLYFHWPGGPGWPAFNVADAVLSSGILLLLFRTMLGSHSEGENAPDPLPDR